MVVVPLLVMWFGAAVVGVGMGVAAVLRPWWKSNGSSDDDGGGDDVGGGE